MQTPEVRAGADSLNAQGKGQGEWLPSSVVWLSGGRTNSAVPLRASTRPCSSIPRFASVMKRCQVVTDSKRPASTAERWLPVLTMCTPEGIPGTRYGPYPLLTSFPGPDHPLHACQQECQQASLG